MKIIFNFITMMLINHTSNMRSSRFIFLSIIFSAIFNYPNLYKQVKINELLDILHFKHDITLKCTCKFSTFKYYNKIHQNFNGKIGLKLNLTNHFQTYLLFIFIVPIFFNFFIHLIINSKKGTMFLLCYFQSTFVYFC